MVHSFYPKLKLTKVNKVNYISYKVWRYMYLSSITEIHKGTDKRLRARSSTIPTTFVNSNIIIYTGAKWRKKRVTTWLVGFKVGEFTWNRRLALYKAKQLRKKSKKKK